MDGVAETVISHPRLDDAPSLFQLRVVGLDYAHPQYGPHRKQFCDVLKVTAPLDAGRRIFKYKMGRQTIPFDKDDWEGAVAFTDGFTSDSCHANRIALYKLGSTKSLASWDTSRSNDEGKAARIRNFQRRMQGAARQVNLDDDEQNATRSSFVRAFTNYA